jgi:integrase/recombinase XerC
LKKNNSKWLDLYMKNCALLNKSARTIQNYRADLTAFIQWHESKYSGDISRARARTIEEYQNFLTYGGLISPRRSWAERLLQIFKKKRSIGAGRLRSPLSVNSRRRHLSSLKNFFDYLKQTHEEKGSRFKLNPVKPKIHAVLVKDIDISHTKYLKPTEWELIYEKTWRTKERLILYLLYFAGLRLHEICLLKREYFNRQSGTITFPRKGGKVHTLKLKNGDAIFDQLDYWFENRSGDSSFLFQGSKNAPLSVRAMSALIRKMISRASITNEITPHSFRKACATNLYLTTKDLLFVRDYLGHSDASVTQTYIDKNALHERHLRM